MSKAVAINGCNKDIRMKDDISLSSSPTEKKDGAISLFSRLLRLDSLSKRNSSSPSSPTTSTEPPTTYYGVYIPCEIKKAPDEEAIHVYKTRAEALELMKRYKAARFKVFQNQKDAITFALRGAEPVDNHEGNDSSIMGEKPYPFKAPSPQDMVSLRKAIEAGLTSTVRDRIWDNPRYLISSGSTPSILQEGSRYNALHVAAKAMNAEICNLILTTVGNPAFVQTLYGTDADPECCKEFAGILLDRYLNTPDKAMNETPLHFAAKYGAVEAVDVLTSFPQCDKTAANKYGEQPKQVICKRSNTSTAETALRIEQLLQERFYVPVVHTEDDSAAPAVGIPFSPAQPPDLNGDPLSPRCEIRAFAGPMAASQADSFRRKWRTPPRGGGPPASPRRDDIAKRWESVGRTLAEEMKIDWKEYWPFLDTFTDLRSTEGLTLLENYIKTKYETDCSFLNSEYCDESKSLEDLSVSQISISFNSSQKDNALSPMSELCVAMKTCSLASDRLRMKTDPIRQRLCRQPNAKPITTDGDSPTINNIYTVSQLLCIERTCQVFAKRIADGLIFSLTAELEIAGESLKAEAKHLQNTIMTYMEDERFQTINFALIHSRLAQLVVFKLKQQTKDLDDINSLMEFLVKLRCPNDDIFSSDDEKKPVYNRYSRVKITHVIDCHLRCLASFISEELTEKEGAKGPSSSETECTEIWDKASKCRCEWKVEQFERNSKNASFRKNRSILSSSPKGESFIKRLTFDYDIGDSKSQQQSVNKPSLGDCGGGDTAPAPLYTVQMTKCELVEAEISDDDGSDAASSDDDAYLTASEQSAHDEDEMHEASDRAIVEPFIYGQEPTKTDRLVYDAIADCDISKQQYPYVSLFKHTIAQYTPDKRQKWLPALISDESPSPITCSLRVHTPVGVRRHRRGASLRWWWRDGDTCSTPKKKEDTAPTDDGRENLSLQVSSWLRVTGPNSPRSAISSKNVRHNVSFGF